MRNKFNIINGKLTAHDNVVYSKIYFEDSFHEDLCFVLKDPEQAKLIYAAYKSYLASVVPVDFLPSVKSALLKISILFGSKNSKIETTFYAAMNEENREASLWFSQNKSVSHRFLEEANKPARAYTKLPSQKNEFTVVILTTSMCKRSSVADLELMDCLRLWIACG